MLHGNSNLSSGATPPTRPGTPLAPAHTEAAAAQAPPRADGVLVLYSFALTDELSLGNLRFFVANAMREGDGAEYAVIVNLGPQETLASLALPDLPANGRYMHHANECYDWGTYAWALDELGADSVASYKCALPLAVSLLCACSVVCTLTPALCINTTSVVGAVGLIQ